MKATVASLLGTLFTIGAFAQGTVNFANNSVTRLVTNSTASPWPGQSPNQIGFTTGAGQYTIGLYIAPAGTIDPNAFMLMGPTTTNAPIFPGLFNGNPAGGFFVISNNTGQPIAFQVRAWSTAFGTSRETLNCCGGYAGLSEIGSVTPDVGGSGPNLFGTDAGQIGGIGLTPWPVPEPSSTVLFFLGAVGLGLWRFRFRQR